MGVSNSIIELNLSSLHLRVIAMGGNGFGESFLVLFQENENVIYSIVIDDFITTIDGENVNLSKKFIEYLGIKKVDCIIWTHPHDDHSIGLANIIDTYYGKNTIGIIPKYIYGNKYDIVSISESCKTVRKMFSKKFRTKGGKSNLITIDCARNEARSLIKRTFKDYNTGNTKDFELLFLTPIGQTLDKYMEDEIMLSKSRLNELSISFVLNFDEYCFYFGGDTPDSLINLSCNEVIEKCKWTTIPHHGSKTSIQLRSILKKNFDCAFCSTYFKNSLPSDEVLKAYKNIETNHIDVTQKTMPDTHSYGVVEYDYDFNSIPKSKLIIKRYGNAYKY